MGLDEASLESDSRITGIRLRKELFRSLQRRSGAGIEKRIILQQPHRMDRRLKRGVALQMRVRLGSDRAQRRVNSREPLTAWPRSGAAVNHHYRMPHPSRQTSDRRQETRDWRQDTFVSSLMSQVSCLRSPVSGLESGAVKRKRRRALRLVSAANALAVIPRTCATAAAVCAR